MRKFLHERRWWISCSKAPDRKALFLLQIKIKQNPAYPNKQFNVTFKHFRQNIRAYPKNKKNSTNQKIYKLTNDWENVAYWEKSQQSEVMEKKFGLVQTQLWDLGRVAMPGKFCSFSPLLNLETVFLALKLARNCYLKWTFLFHENWEFNHTLSLPLSSTNILRLLTKYQINGTSKIPISHITLWWIEKSLEVQPRLIFKKPNFLFFSWIVFSWIGKNWEVQLEQHSKIPKSLC